MAVRICKTVIYPERTHILLPPISTHTDLSLIYQSRRLQGELLPQRPRQIGESWTLERPYVGEFALIQLNGSAQPLK